MMKCNGCGREIIHLAAVYAYGNVTEPHFPNLRSAPPTLVEIPDYVQAEHFRTLCPRCHHVMKDILLHSDLSDHWDNYEWSLMGGEYTEQYD